MEIDEEGANLLMVEVSQDEVRPAAARRFRQECQELREIRLVGADGVQRGVLVQPEVLEEGFYFVSHHGVGARRLRPGQAARARARQPHVQIRQRARRMRDLARFLATESPAVLRLPRRRVAVVDRRHDAEGDVRRLIVPGICVRHVVGAALRAPSSSAGRCIARPMHERGGVPARHQTRRRRLDVPSTPEICPAKNRSSRSLHLPGLAQDGRAVDVGVAMNHAETHELGVLEPGNQLEYARLLAPFHLRLKPDQAEMIAGQRVLPQLDDRVGLAAGARIRQARRASSARTAACPRRARPSPRSAGTPRRTSHRRTRAAPPSRRP